MRLLACLTLLLALPAVAQTSGRSPALPTGEGKDDAALASYRVAEERFDITIGPPEAKGRSFTAFPASFPSPVKSRWTTIHGTYYRPARLRPGQRVPAAVVVHHLGGSFDAEKVLAQHLAINGVSAFFISLPNYGLRREPNTREGFLSERDPLAIVPGFRQAALDVIRAGDFLRAMPEVDPERVGVVGVSLGAVVSALARGVDTRLGRTMLVIGGGDLHRLLTESPEAKQLLERAKVAPDQIRPALALIQPMLKPIDPVTFARRVRTQDVLMVNAANDEVIPRSSTVALWEALGQPEIKWMRCGHYGSVLHLLTIMNDALDHLRGE
jgi:cephalosporin-C deacetylase-like acetyl esterase